MSTINLTMDNISEILKSIPFVSNAKKDTAISDLNYSWFRVSKKDTSDEAVNQFLKALELYVSRLVKEKIILNSYKEKFINGFRNHFGLPLIGSMVKTETIKTEIKPQTAVKADEKVEEVKIEVEIPQVKEPDINPVEGVAVPPPPATPKIEPIHTETLHVEKKIEPIRKVIIPTHVQVEEPKEEMTNQEFADFVMGSATMCEYKGGESHDIRRNEEMGGFGDPETTSTSKHGTENPILHSERKREETRPEEPKEEVKKNSDERIKDIPPTAEEVRSTPNSFRESEARNKDKIEYDSESKESKNFTPKQKKSTIWLEKALTVGIPVVLGVILGNILGQYTDKKSKEVSE